jgi:lysophospholipase L1-like esterase
MERPGPGVVYDSLGIVGARANRLLNAEPTHLAEQVKHRAPDLLVIAFGGNEAGDERMNMEKYREGLVKVVRALRAGRPDASCLLLAPLDQGEVGPRGGVRSMPTIPKIVESQRQVAADEGCAFFDTWKAMGGNGAMGRWYKSRPRLGWGDYRHASPAGYELIGNLFYKALLKGFADWLARPDAAVPAAAPIP